MSSDAAIGQDAAVQVRPRGAATAIGAGAQAATLAGHETLPTEYVDGVRGIAAFYVVLNHARFLLFISAATALATHPSTIFKGVLALLAITRYGVAGVMCFFIVSGYAIHYRQAFKLAGTWQPMSWRGYAWHRVRRLYPPLLVALGITFAFDLIGAHFYPGMYQGTSTVLSLGGDHTPTIGNLFGTLTFVQGFATKVFGSNDPLWSLAYEGFFYLMYPLVLGLDQRLGPVKTLALFTALGLSVGAIIGMGISPDGLGVDLFSPLGIASHALNLLALWPAWVAGVFIADARAGRVQIPTRWWSIGAVAGLLMLGASALYLVVKNPNIAINNLNIFYLVWVVSFFGPIGWLCAARHPVRMRTLVGRVFGPLSRLGKMSYSLYVVHFPTLAVVCALWLVGHNSLPRTPWLMLGGILAALSVAFITYYFAERPFTGKRNLNRVEAQVQAESGMLPAVTAAPRNDRLPEVRRAAQAWAQQRWQAATSEVGEVRELPRAEFSMIPNQVGGDPDQAWLVRLRLTKDGLAPTVVSALVVQRYGAVWAVDPPGSVG